MAGIYLEQIKDLVLKFMKNETATIFLFGSMAGKDSHPGSDVDVGLMPGGEFDMNKLTLLREKIEELNTPYKVEIVDFRHVSEGFKKEAMKSVILWKD